MTGLVVEASRVGSREPPIPVAGDLTSKCEEERHLVRNFVYEYLVTVVGQDLSIRSCGLECSSCEATSGLSERTVTLMLGLTIRPDGKLPSEFTKQLQEARKTASGTVFEGAFDQDVAFSGDRFAVVVLLVQECFAPFVAYAYFAQSSSKSSCRSDAPFHTVCSDPSSTA